ncbi:MAG TPA: hypothetical protein VGI71_21860 [Scandinavium sp.]|jgi:hypothetical protein
MHENIVPIGRDKSFPVCGELFERLENIIHEDDGEIGLAEAIGILEMLKIKLLNSQCQTN